MNKIAFVCGVWLMLSSVVGMAQGFDPFLFQKEKELQGLFNELTASTDDYLRGKINDRILEAFDAALAKENSFEYEFDSIKISKLWSQDENLRVITWNLPHEDGSFSYYGYLQYNDGKKYVHYKLLDKSDEIEKPETARLTPENWYGVLYYQIIDSQKDGQQCYTLLGWDGYNNIATQKVIDVLCVKPNYKIEFGANVFNYYGKTKKRVVFRFTDRATMLLKWEAKKKMIIFEHLSPLSPEYVGMAEFYGPDSSWDAFRLKKGIWTLDTIVDGRNEKRDPRYKPLR